MDVKNDTVVLDGPGQPTRWPLELAEDLLADPATWGTDIRGYFGSSLLTQEEREKAAQQRYRYNDAYRLAAVVNAYNRHPVDWGGTFFNGLKAEGSSLAHYSTQELLDAFFMVVRQERFNDGLVASLEPHLRQIVTEVVRRIHSTTPPVFIPVR